MFTTGKVLVLAALAAGAFATPVVQAEPAITPGPSLEKRATCTFSGSDGASKAHKSQQACATMVLSNLKVPAGETLNLDKLADNTHVIFEGHTTWGYEEWKGPLMRIQGTGITIEGADGHYLDGQGDRWWDGKGGNGGVKKPKFFAAHKLYNSKIKNLHIQNSPVHVVSLHDSEHVTIEGLTIDNTAGDNNGGHNTDGIDIGKVKHITITGANIYNQDDCVAINSGEDITFSDSTCSGGHGLSIGSVGGGDTVKGVTFKNNVIKNSDNGCRVKARKNNKGLIQDITYQDIILQNIHKYGILIEQNYDGGDLHGDPSNTLPIKDLTLRNIKGHNAVDSKGHNIAVVCGSGSCTGWDWSGVDVTGGKKYSKCKNVPGVAHC